MAKTKRRLKAYEELSFTDDFMFCKVLQNNPDLCKELTELIIGREIGQIARISKQRPIEITSDGHGVRFDILMKDEAGTEYDIEMQTVSLPELPRRTRYYHSMMDLDLLERGISYRKLPGSYVIFICLENPFKQAGLHKYTFSSCCEELKDLYLGDGAKSIFLSAEGTAVDVSDDMKAFLRYLKNHTAESSLTRRLEAAVIRAKKRREWSVEYMNLYEIRQMEREEGREEGRAEGEAEGKVIALAGLVHDGLMTSEAAADRAEKKYGIKKEDFQKALENYNSEEELKQG